MKFSDSPLYSTLQCEGGGGYPSSRAVQLLTGIWPKKMCIKQGRFLLSTCCLLLEFLFQNQTHLFLQRWLYSVKINFVRNQHDTEKTRGCSCRQLFRHSWGSSVRCKKQRSSVFVFLLLCWCLAKLIFTQYDHLWKIQSCVYFAYFCWSGLLWILHSTA